MQKKKYVLIPMLLIFALGITGLAYGHWEKIITIGGTVDTGTLDLIIISITDTDEGIDPNKNKHVADTTVIIDPQDPERAIVTITNAYPSYEVFLHFTIQNVGTTPAKLQAITTNAPDCITVGAWNGLGEQIDPISWGGTPDKYRKNNSAEVHVEQSATQGETYTFTIEFVYVNWNEYEEP